MWPLPPITTTRILLPPRTTIMGLEAIRFAAWPHPGTDPGLPLRAARNGRRNQSASFWAELGERQSEFEQAVGVIYQNVALAQRLQPAQGNLREAIARPGQRARHGSYRVRVRPPVHRRQQR